LQEQGKLDKAERLYAVALAWQRATWLKSSPPFWRNALAEAPILRFLVAMGRQRAGKRSS
jgi:hypothetical protein